MSRLTTSIVSVRSKRRNAEKLTGHAEVAFSGNVIGVAATITVVVDIYQKPIKILVSSILKSKKDF